MIKSSNKNYKMINISKHIFQNIFTTCEKLKNHEQYKLQADKFDMNCTRHNLTKINDPLVLELINSCKSIVDSSKSIVELCNIDWIKPTIHHIIYNIEKEYVIEKHHDSCELTTIIYLSKYPDIIDEFYVEDEKIIEEHWDTPINKALAMFKKEPIKYPEHYGKFTGTGKREVLCLFYPILNKAIDFHAPSLL